jgi:hypothetical protein
LGGYAFHALAITSLYLTSKEALLCLIRPVILFSALEVLDYQQAARYLHLRQENSRYLTNTLFVGYQPTSIASMEKQVIEKEFGQASGF